MAERKWPVPGSGTDRVLRALRRHRGRWVRNLYQRTGCMVHSRVADLRRHGLHVESRRLGQGDYAYRLTEEA